MRKIFLTPSLSVAVILASTMLFGCNNEPDHNLEKTALKQVIAEDAQNEPSWREQYAYSMGFAAYQWAFPYLNMTRIRYDWTNIPKN